MKTWSIGQQVVFDAPEGAGRGEIVALGPLKITIDCGRVDSRNEFVTVDLGWAERYLRAVTLPAKATFALTFTMEDPQLRSTSERSRVYRNVVDTLMAGARGLWVEGVRVTGVQVTKSVTDQSDEEKSA